jgi:hypothetical protein
VRVVHRQRRQRKHGDRGPAGSRRACPCLRSASLRPGRRILGHLGEEPESPAVHRADDLLSRAVVTHRGADRPDAARDAGLRHRAPFQTTSTSSSRDTIRFRFRTRWTSMARTCGSTRTRSPWDESSNRSGSSRKAPKSQAMEQHTAEHAQLCTFSSRIDQAPDGRAGRLGASRAVQRHGPIPGGRHDSDRNQTVRHPDQLLDMKERGGISILKMADGSTGMHAIFEPGWTWEADEKPLLGSPGHAP